jgi:hypothetical protein
MMEMMRAEVRDQKNEEDFGVFAMMRSRTARPATRRG